MQPKISSMLFHPKRTAMLDSFVTKVITEKAIDSKVYWEFREFYSPGYFLFEKNGIPSETVATVLQKAPIPVKKEALALNFLNYKSQHLQSIDGLTIAKTVDEIVDSKKLDLAKVLVKTNNVLLYRDDTNVLLLVFVLPESEMRKANGFIDYRDKDKQLVQKRNWANITIIESN